MTGSNMEDIYEYKKQMNKQFDMSDLGLLSYYLGIEVCQAGNSTTIKQSAYAKKIMQK